MRIRTRLKPKQWSRRTWIAVVILVLIVGVVLYVVHGMHTPAVGTIQKSNTSSAPVITDTTNYTSLDTERYSLLYPSDYSGDFGVPQPGALDYKYFSIRDSQNAIKSTLEVYLKPLPYGGITLDGDYKTYAADLAHYKASNKFYHSEAVDLFYKDKGGKERNALWEHGQYLLIIKLHSDGSQNVDLQIKSMLSSVQWK